MEGPRRPLPPRPRVGTDTLAQTKSVNATILPSSAGDDTVLPALPALSRISLSFDDPTLMPAGFPASSSGADLTVTGLLGEGGTSVVYLAHQRQLRRDVALKIVRSSDGPGEGEPRRQKALIAEAMLTGSLEHPNIVPVHALGCDAVGRPLLVMKRIEGVQWRALLDDPNHAAWSRADLQKDDRLTTHLTILVQVANALEYAHSRGVIHRDVKPDNVMVGSFGEVYLVDWGVALPRDWPPGPPRLVGTPAYMAPEMTSGLARDVDPRTDVYLLGATLHHVLTGRFRHDGDEVGAALLAAERSPPVDYPADVPAELAALANAATALDKARRPPSAAAFRQAVADYLHHKSSIALARAAQAKLDEASALPLDSVPSGQRLAECQFGFFEALRTWGDNELAHRGLASVRARLVERELYLGNAVGARAALAEMASPPSELLARVAALEGQLLRERTERERERREAQALDASVLRGPRALMLGLFLVGALVANGFAVAKEVRTGIPMPITDVLWTDLLQLVAVFVALGVAGRRLLLHAYNRRVIGVLLVTLVTVTVIDFVASQRGVGSRTANLIDCVVMCSCFAIATVGIERGWWRIVLVWMGAIAVAAAWPMLANGAASLATVLSVLIGIWVARTAVRTAREKP